MMVRNVTHHMDLVMLELEFNRAGSGERRKENGRN